MGVCRSWAGPKRTARKGNAGLILAARRPGNERNVLRVVDAHGDCHWSPPSVGQETSLRCPKSQPKSVSMYTSRHCLVFDIHNALCGESGPRSCVMARSHLTSPTSQEKINHIREICSACYIRQREYNALKYLTGSNSHWHFLHLRIWKLCVSHHMKSTITWRGVWIG